MLKKLTLCAVILGFIAITVWLGLYDPPNTPATSTRMNCIINLQSIDTCKQQWMFHSNKTTNDIPSWDDLRPYLPSKWKNGKPVCPKGGAYTIGRGGELPTCSIGGELHSLHYPNQ
jgi:hypothetical protein